MEDLGEALRKRSQALASLDVALLAHSKNRRRKPKGGGGSGAGGGSGKGFGGPKPKTAPKPMPARTPTQTRQGLARGSQSAVVKLASYAGAGRIGDVMKYQSRDGQLDLEQESGAKVAADAIQALAARWAAEADTREPSKDVLMLRVTLQDPQEVEIGRAMADAFPGHRYAWCQAGQTVEIVATAASSVRGEDGKAQRIYDNRKSLALLERRVEAAFADAAPTEIDHRGFSHGVEGAARYLSRLTRGGQIDAQTSDGKAASGREANLTLAKSWKRDMRSREQRDVAHIILSARPGTAPEAFTDAARATLSREFAGHEYAFTVHTDRDHLHVHALVRMTNRIGERIDPKIGDFKRWRATLAEEARERNIPMEAPSRFESANPPAYKLKDIRRVERGEASEATRRRVAAVRERAVHVPTRAEGVACASAVAREWRDLAATAPQSSRRVTEPPLRSGSLRLYRVESATTKLPDRPLFTTERSAADRLVQQRAGAHITFIDVTSEQRKYIAQSQNVPGKIFVVSAELAITRKPLQNPETTNITHHVSRTAEAVRLAAERAVSESKETTAVPNVQTMEDSRKRVQQGVEALGELLKEKQAVDALKAAGDTIQDRMGEAIRRQKQIDANAGEVSGQTYVKPELQHFSGYLAEQRGESVRYAHRVGEATAGKTAFVDTGAKVEVRDWRDRETTLAAMQLAAEKWKEGITVKGPPRYQTMVLELAAEHGIKIANPELRERLEAERARVVREREATPGFMQTAPAKELDPAYAVESTNRYETEEKHDTYNSVTTYKTSEVAKMMETIREARHGRKVDGNRLEKPDAGLGAVIAARRDAVHSVEPAQRLDFMRVSREPVPDNLSGDKRDEQKNALEKAAQRYLRENPVLAAQKSTQPGRSEFERDLRLDRIHREVHKEAARETRQANIASALNETPIDPGYRSQGEAAEAREADRRIEGNRLQQMPTTSSDSPRMQQLGDEQRGVLKEDEQAKRTVAEKQQQQGEKPRGQRM